MYRRLGLGALLLVLGVPLLVLGRPSPVAAQGPRAVILDFDGRGGPRARREVVRALADVLDLARRRDAEDAARRIRADLRTPEGLSDLAREMDVKVLVKGQVEGRGRRARTHIRVVDALGNEVAFRESGTPFAGAGRRRIRRDAREAVEQAMEVISEREEREAAAARAEELERQRELEAQRRRAAADDGLVDTDIEDEDEDDTPPPEGSQPLLAVYVGAGGRTRNADLDLADGGARIYDAGLFMELQIRLESRPLGRSDSLAARGLHLEAEFDMSLGLSTQEDGADGEIGTTAWRFFVNAGYLAQLVDGRLQVGPLVGFGYDVFSLDDNMTMPSAEYVMLRAGLATIFDIVPQVFHVRADFGFRLPFSMGPIADAFGADGSAKGFDVGIALGGRLDVGFAYAIRFGYNRYSLDFSGAANDAMGDSGADKALAVGALLGWTI